MIVGISGKKEMGIAVKAIAQYAEEQLNNGNYVEMVNAFKVALNMADMYKLREMEDLKNSYIFFVNDAKTDLQAYIKMGERAQKELDMIEDMI